MSLINKFLVAAMALFLATLPAAADVVIIPSIPYILQNGTVADATQVMADLNQIISYVNTNAAGNGTNTSITSLTGLTSPPAGSGALKFYGTTVGGTANAILITAAYPGGFNLTNSGTCIWFKPAFTNTGAVTINVNSTGVVSLKRGGVTTGPIAMQGGELTPANAAEICWDGSNYNLQSQPQDTVEWPLPYSNLASSATTTLSIANCPFQKCQITGISTITSFDTAATAGQIYYLQFTGGSTLTYNAVSMILPGAASILTRPQDTAYALYLGGGNWQVLVYTQAIQQFNNIGGLVPQALGWSAVNHGATPGSQIDIAAQTAMITNVNYTASVACTNVSVVLNLAQVGLANGNSLDAGSLSGPQWIYLYIISNGTTCASLASASSTTPTLPTGYIYYARFGAMQVDGSNLLYRQRLAGRRAQYVVTSTTNTPTMPILVNGATGNVSTPVYTAFQVTGNGKIAPPTAAEVIIALAQNGNTAMVAPNNQFGAYNSTNPAPCQQNGGNHVTQCDLILESNSVYIAAQSAYIFGYGWVDAVAAN